MSDVEWTAKSLMVGRETSIQTNKQTLQQKIEPWTSRSCRNCLTTKPLFHFAFTVSLNLMKSKLPTVTHFRRLACVSNQTLSLIKNVFLDIDSIYCQHLPSTIHS